MHIRDFDGVSSVSSIVQLDEVLLKRHQIDGSMVNSFWIYHDGEYPCMSILVRDSLATIWYTPEEANAGYVSSDYESNVNSDKFTLFYFDKNPQEVPDNLVVDWPKAVEAARQFLKARDLPSSLHWIDL